MCKFLENAQPWKPDGHHYVWDLSNAQYLLLELNSHRISNKYIKNLMRNTVTARPMVASSAKRDDIKVSLMEMEAQVHQKISNVLERNVTLQCNRLDPASSWHLTQTVQITRCLTSNSGHRWLHTARFEEVDKSREEKLKALETQAAALRASLADPGQTLAELLPLISKHVQIQDIACKKMPVNTEKMLKN